MNSYVNDFNTTVKTYYKELKKCNPISREEEVELIKKAKNNNLVAKNKILSSNLKFVFNVAKKYKGCGAPLEDLISEGNIGLTKAIDKFDETRNVKFISYAVWWIRQSIQEFIKKRQQLLSVELSENDELNGCIHESRLIDSDDDIVNKNEVVLSDEEYENNKELEKNRAIVLNNLLKKLNPRGQFIVKSYYGIGIKKEMTLEEIGNVLKISKERVRQIKEKQLRILRTELMMSGNMSLIFS